MLSQEKYEECKELYLSGKSIMEVCRIKNADRHTLANRLKKENIQLRPKTEHSRKHFFDEHYFDIVNTEEKAYILGYLYADGNNLFKTNRISIKLSIKDKEILQKFSNILYGKEILRYSSRLGKRGQLLEYYALELHSEHFSRQLDKLGMHPAKSKIITFPEWLDKNLYKHFIRGLIDGDGWIFLPKDNTSPNVGLICTRKINDFLQDFYLKELGLPSCLCKAYKQDINIMCEIRVKNYHNGKILLDWLYKDVTIYLKRKYDIYQRFLERYENIQEHCK